MIVTGNVPPIFRLLLSIPIAAVSLYSSLVSKSKFKMEHITGLIVLGSAASFYYLHKDWDYPFHTFLPNQLFIIVPICYVIAFAVNSLPDKTDDVFKTALREKMRLK